MENFNISKQLIFENKCIIFGSSPILDYSFYENSIFKNNFIICADGGIDHARKLGLTPDVLIGDMDSCEDCSNFKNIIVHPKEKDDTDSILCLKYALEKNFSEVLMLGCLGGRLDHTLANIQALKFGFDNSMKIKLLDETTFVFLIDKTAIIKKSDYKYISFLPLTEKVDGISYTGLKYPLSDAIFEVGNPYGISNEIIEDEATVKIKNGLLICILTV